MSISIIGPEGKKAELKKSGDYFLRRQEESGAAALTVLEGPDNESILSHSHRSISRKHLMLSLYDTLRLVDEGSKNGSHLNEERFKATEITSPGTYTLKLGNVPFQIEYDLQSA